MTVAVKYPVVERRLRVMKPQRPHARRERPRTWVPWSVKDATDPLESRSVRMDGDAFRRIAKDKKLQAAERVRCELDPWHWLLNYVTTLDEHWRRKGLTVAYSRWPDDTAMRSLAHLLWRERLVALPKSRQWMATWGVAAYLCGDAIMTGGRLYMIQSKGEADAQAVLRRIVGIWERMRMFAPWLGPDTTQRSAGMVEWANESRIIALPQGAHYVQSHTPSWWYADEIQLQAEAREAFFNALPACENITLCGTADYGWFWEEFLTGKGGGHGSDISSV